MNQAKFLFFHADAFVVAVKMSLVKLMKMDFISINNYTNHFASEELLHH